MCGLDDVKIFSPNPLPMTGQPDSVENTQSIKIDSQEKQDDILIQRDDVIDTSEKSQVLMPDAELQAQLDRLTELSSEQSFRSVGKEELALALKQSHLNCVISFKGKHVGLEYAMQVFNALPAKGKGKVDFAGIALTSADRLALDSAIRHGLLREEAKNNTLLTYQERVAKAMKDLAFIECNHKELANPNSAESAIVEEAIEAQLALGDLLMERINASPVTDTTVLEEMQRRCMMRASEINQLKNEMVRLATSDYYKTGAPVVIEEAEDPNVICTSSKPKQVAVQAENTVVLEGGKDNTALSGKSFVSMLPRMASKMHGTDVLGQLQGEMSGMLQQLAAFQKGEPDEKALLQINKFDADITHTRQVLSEIRKNGMKIGQDGSAMRLNEALLDSLEKFLEEGQGRVRDIGKGVFGLAVKKVIKAEIGKFPLTELDGYEEILQNGNWNLVRTLHEKLQALRNALKELHENYEGTPSLEKLKNAAREVKNLTLSEDFYDDFASQYIMGWDNLRTRMESLARRNPENLAYKNLAAKLEEMHAKSGGNCFQMSPFNLLAGQCQKLESIVNHIVMMGENYAERIGDDERESNRMYDAVFHGQLPFETAVEARIHNVALEDIAQGTSDAERTECSKLGEGGSNSVYHCKYKNGQNYVFKPEILGRCALNHMVYVSGTDTFQSQQTILNLNVASTKCAKLLGIGKRIVETKGGVVNGKFGILMGLAKGKGSSEWNVRRARAELKTLLQNAPGGKKGIYGKMRRQMSELHWLDLLTGQIDRHWNNYKLDIGTDGSVEIQGIDNDCCFGDTMVGVNTYELNDSHKKQFITYIKDAVRQIYRNTAEAKQAMKTIQEQILDHLPPGSRPGSVIVDLKQFKNIFVVNELKRTIGCQSYSMPDKIGKDTYDHLMELRANPALLDEALQGRISPKALENTKARLQQLCEHAEHLKNTGNLIDGDAAWEDDAMAQTSMNPLDDVAFKRHLADQGLPPAHLNTQYYNSYLISMSQNYFQRDYIDLCKAALR